MIETIFWKGVELLKVGAKLMGMSYQEINVYLFVFLHPAITLIFISLWLFEKQRKNF